MERKEIYRQVTRSQALFLSSLVLHDSKANFFRDKHEDSKREYHSTEVTFSEEGSGSNLGQDLMMQTYYIQRERTQSQ